MNIIETNVTMFDDNSGTVNVPALGDRHVEWEMDENEMPRITDAGRCEIAEEVGVGAAEDLIFELEEAISDWLAAVELDHAADEETCYCDICDSPMSPEDYADKDGICSPECWAVEHGRGAEE